ncbi:MAG: alanine--tRNA ligase [Cyclobacteriaceae bacterium]
MDSNLIRKKFLEFFQKKGHQIVASAPMVIKNDPTLMFTNAGMNQFKEYFLGDKKASDSRVADSQKCLRVSGKHNDLEEVGIDTYHHTMFEMLGNWSFGDYFKKEAIAWAWELLIHEYQLPADKMYVTIFGGDKADGLEEDTEAKAFWEEILPPERVLPFGKSDNFWEMGDTGPCGPCSEIHVDLRPEEERLKQPATELINMDHPQVIEIWNLVFIQFNRLTSGELKSLPAKHIDTGMGFERLVRAIQSKSSNYDTDLFQPLIQKVCGLAGVQYGTKEEVDIALRVIADHLRAIAFAIADGELPSNNKAGYVIRRILRRAVRYGYTFLGFEKPFLFQLVTLLADQMQDIFPELKAQESFVAKVIEEEELSFLRTLSSGLKRLEQLRKEINNNDNQIKGEIAFELYDTFGFPYDLTALIARENGWTIDQAGFEKEMAAQKNRSKTAAYKETGDWTVLIEDQPSDFVGYDQLESQSNISKYREVKQKGETTFQVVLDQTPFYAESGGQVGDTGYLENDRGSVKVIDTQKENDLIVHWVPSLPDPVDSGLRAVVNTDRRSLTENNHSATHLLHAALRQVLGDHVQQKGSLVNDQYLRFDFSHFSKMTEEELLLVEQLVNQRIQANIARDERREVPMSKAQEMGAMALFGEKYGEKVRVITFDPDFSVELCGGTHVDRTGKIGIFKILSESSVAAGVRRLEAITASAALKMIDQKLQELEEMHELLKNPKDAVKALADIMEERRALKKEVEAGRGSALKTIKEALIIEAEEIGGVQVIVKQVALSTGDELKKLSFELKNKFASLFMVLAADIKGKPQIAVMISEPLAADRGFNAGAIVKDLAAEIKGGGGGQPFYATAGGKDLAGLPKVVSRAKDFISQHLTVQS